MAQELWGMSFASIHIDPDIDVHNSKHICYLYVYIYITICVYIGVCIYVYMMS